MKPTLVEPLIAKPNSIDDLLKPRWLGYVYQVTLTIFICLQLKFAKFLFQRNPDLNIVQLLAFRSMIAFGIFLYIIRGNIWTIIFWSIPRKLIPLLALKIAAGLIYQICINIAAKSLPLVYVALSQNLGPLLTAI